MLAESRRSRRRLRLRGAGARQARRRRAELFQRHRPRGLLRPANARRSPTGVGGRRRSTRASPSSSRSCCRSAPPTATCIRVDLPAAARSRLDADRDLARLRLHLLRDRRARTGSARRSSRRARSPATSPLGERFLDDLAPFIWRKYFDFAAIADIHAMKRQIHAVRGHDEIAVAGHDIKLGRGGIREIEFFVQTQQLVFGGRRPALRGRRTLDMLAALHDEGWITDAGARRARRGLPLPAHDRAPAADGGRRADAAPAVRRGRSSTRFAQFCGYADLTALREGADRSGAASCETHYALLFEEGPELASDVGNLVFTGTTDDPETLATLRRLGFHEPERVAETVRGWHFGRRPAVTSAARPRGADRARARPARGASAAAPIPTARSPPSTRRFGRMPAAVELFSILQSHDRLRLLFADLLGTAPRLADTVAQPAACPRRASSTRPSATPRHGRARHRGAGRGSSSASRRDFEDFLDRAPRCGAARCLRRRRAAAVRHALARRRPGEAYAAIARRRHPRSRCEEVRAALRGRARRGSGRADRDPRPGPARLARDDGRLRSRPRRALRFRRGRPRKRRRRARSMRSSTTRG